MSQRSSIGVFGQGFRANPNFHWGVDFLTDEDLTEGVATAIASGAWSILDGAINGIARVTSSGANDGGGFQLDTAAFAPFNGAELNFITRVRSSLVATDKLVAGLSLVDTSQYASNPNDWVVFRMDADGKLDCSVRVNGSEAFVATDVLGSTLTTPLITLANSTWLELGLQITQNRAGTKQTYAFYANGIPVYSVENTGTLLPSSTPYLTPTVEVIQGAAGTFDVDLIGAVSTRQ